MDVCEARLDKRLLVEKMAQSAGLEIEVTISKEMRKLIADRKRSVARSRSPTGGSKAMMRTTFGNTNLEAAPLTTVIMRRDGARPLKFCGFEIARISKTGCIADLNCRIGMELNLCMHHEAFLGIQTTFPKRPDIRPLYLAEAFRFGAGDWMRARCAEHLKTIIQPTSNFTEQQILAAIAKLLGDCFLTREQINERN